MPRRDAPVGRATRGTTGTNRLRRIDRWIAASPALRRAADPLVVDLGFGASATTTLELEARLRPARSDVEVVGLEIDPARVAGARGTLAEVRAGRTPFAADASVSFALGGFEVPTPAGRRPIVIRAMNVLRQYDESDVADAWRRMTGRLAAGGVLLDGTCDEIGRVSTWVALDSDGTASTLTISLRLSGLESPSITAERLPKALIHRNIPGERIHDLLGSLEAEWHRAAALQAFGPSQRWIATVGALREAGWGIRDTRARWRLGELTVPWHDVAPREGRTATAAASTPGRPRQSSRMPSTGRR